MKLAQRMIRPKSGTLDPSMLEDHYRIALMRTLRRSRRSDPLPQRRSSLRRQTLSSLWMRSAEALRPSVLLQNPHRGEAPQNLRPDAQRALAGPDKRGEANAGAIDRQRDHRKANKHALAPRPRKPVSNSTTCESSLILFFSASRKSSRAATHFCACERFRDVRHRGKHSSSWASFTSFS